MGTLVRLLLVGGGGCGKTRIFNRVLVPLLEAFYGSHGVMKGVDSSKTATLSHGKTICAEQIEWRLIFADGASSNERAERQCAREHL